MDALATANYSQWYLAHKARSAAVEAAKDSGVSQVPAPKQAKTVAKDDDDLRYMHSEFMTDPDDFSSLRSETPFNDLQVSDDQLSDPKDTATPELRNFSSRPKARPLRDPL